MDRLVRCSGPLFLPVLYDDNDKSLKTELAADWGHGVHHWKATGEFIGVYAKQIQARVEKSRIDRLALWPADGLHEVAMAYNPLTDEIRTAKGDVAALDRWKATFKFPWSTGTADYVRVHNGRLRVDDLKTGSPDPRFPPTMPEDSYQVRWYATVYAELIHWGGPVDGSITHWPRPDAAESLRPRTTRPPDVFVAEIPREALWEMKKQLKRVANEAVACGPLRPHKETCKFCSADCKERYKDE
jgi:hypothetical protein